MAFRGYMLLVFGLLFSGALAVQAGRNLRAGQSFAVQQPAESSSEAPKQVDVKASDLRFDRELNKRLGIDENAKILVGNVAFHHNGAVIACDSAVQYSNSHIDCFRNVIINKDSTFVYGDRAEYNGEENIARVYSPIIKVIDGSAILYTYNFSFNTLDNIGTWFGGGVLYQDDAVMESEKGYFYSDLHELVAVRNVQMKNDSHELISDSVRYNTETKVAHFLTRTLIWTHQGEMIRAERGRYNTTDSTYFFHDNAYLLTEFRETWADSIDFNARSEDALLLGNVQIDDNEHDSSAFGDWAQYWGSDSGLRVKGETMLTRLPSMMNYNADEGNADTMYMRADTIFMFVRYPERDSIASALAREQLEGQLDSMTVGASVDSLPEGMREELGAEVGVFVADSLYEAVRDSLALTATGPVSPPDTLSAAELKEWRAAEKAAAKAEKQRLKRERRAAKIAARDAKWALRDSLRAIKDSTRNAAQEAKLTERRARVAAKRGWVTETIYSDSLADVADSVARMEAVLHEDSLLTAGLLDSFATPVIEPMETETQGDSAIRIFRGWRNVKIWRSDMQSVADSMVGFSTDSTIHLYRKPVLWSGDSQITSDSMTIFTAGGAIERAEFQGSPVMGSLLGEVINRQFNQVKGKYMTSWFRKGELYRHDAKENAQALYYYQEGSPSDPDYDPEPQAFTVSTAEAISFFFASDSLRYISQYGNVHDIIYPMDQIPPSQSTRLQGFEWHEDRRPVLADVFDRRLRPSERAEHEGLARPDFPIAARINRRREYLISNRMWGDRTDPLPAYAVEFRRQNTR